MRRRFAPSRTMRPQSDIILRDAAMGPLLRMRDFRYFPFRRNFPIAARNSSVFMQSMIASRSASS